MIGNENHEIPLAEAAKLTKTYRDNPIGLLPNLVQIKGEAFGRDAIESVLAQPGVTGIRIYYGLDFVNLLPMVRLVIVGINVLGNDITTGVILEAGRLCPPNCGVNNVLNT